MTQLERLGWSPFFDESFLPWRARGFVPARVAEEHRERFVVLGERGETPAEPTGRLRFAAADRLELPAVGDWVALQPNGDSVALVHAVLPRRGAFLRRAAGDETVAQVVAANVDTAVVVTDADRDFNPRRLERYLALCRESGASPVILVNKCDLAGRLDELLARAVAIAAGAPVLAASAVTGRGLEALRERAEEGRTIAFLGSSGVGKSTLINRLLGEERLKTSAVRAADGRGRHTTTWRHLLLLPGGGVAIDTPGMRELRLWGDEESLGAAFQEVEALASGCRFADCRHEEEPGCAVLDALAGGSLDAERLESYRKLGRELRFLERKQDVRARLKEKARWKTVHRSVREHMKRKYGGG